MLDADGKIEVIRSYARRSGFRTFVETGTADGYTVAGLLGEFDRVYTIELGHEAYLQCFRRFAPQPKVTCLWGSSEKVLWHVMEVLDGPAVFWLDAHYTGGAGTRGEVDTPIKKELLEVFGRSRRDVVLIDDARLFGTDPAYPTVDWVRQFLVHYPGFHFELKDDIMRIVPEVLSPSPAVGP